MIKEAFKWLVSTPQEPRSWWKVIVLEASVCGICAVTRAALCAGRGTAFARRPAAAVMLKKRRRAEYRLSPDLFARLVSEAFQPPVAWASRP